MHFIKLRDKSSGRSVYVNMEKVFEIMPLDGGGSNILYPVHDGSGDCFYTKVHESPEEILAKI